MTGGIQGGETFAAGQLAFHASLREAATALGRGTVSAVELTRGVLDRIAELNPRLSALSDAIDERALADAAKADRQRAGGVASSPLAGVPVAIKDLIDTTPAVCSAGLSFLDGYRPAQDAAVVRRLRAAGAVVVGVSATDPGAFGVRTPAATHPQAPDRVVGGSSGGSGAALAAGLAFGALGTDTGGSIRIPSACCAVTGLKPTRGRVSLEGVRPLVWSLDHVGPMARSVADLALMQAVLDPDYVSTGPTGARRALRVGHDPAYWADADARVVTGMAAALSACRGLGAEVVEVTLPRPEDVVQVHTVIFCAESRAYYAAELSDKWGEFPPVVRQLLDLARQHTGAEYVAATRTREAFTRQVETLFEDVDVLVVPTLPVLAPQRDAQTVALAGTTHDYTLAMVRYTCLFDHTGHPVVAMPVDVDGPGLAVSAQIVGPLNRDRVAVEFAERLESALALSIDYTIRD